MQLGSLSETCLPRVILRNLQTASVSLSPTTACDLHDLSLKPGTAVPLSFEDLALHPRATPVAGQELLNMSLSDIRKDDTFVLVVGQTGSGRSTFINRAVGSPVAEVGHGLTPKTTSIRHFPTAHPRNRGRRFIFVDTPGFDSPNLQDWQILDGIVTWLRKIAGLRTKVVIIYLIEIDQPRKQEAVGMNPRKLLNVMDAHLVIATTKWSNLRNVAIGHRREAELSTAYSREVLRFHDTQESAWAIVDGSQPPINSFDIFLLILRRYHAG
ncbi:hypothetical protein LshimejAT787_0702220 [Lyophyllum shimeji]|uniref:G domain-containing protein n=1 Tax=Lyophyllum shimeji TaxID=47721 RepID=A0A9P3PNK2_LYOSH|nr:hypothetical protein LshimejAT787_0702220 [Lyophyllum shimeji]